MKFTNDARWLLFNRWTLDLVPPFLSWLVALTHVTEMDNVLNIRDIQFARR